MRKFSKKAFSVLLAGTLILGSVPSTVFASSTYSKLQSPERTKEQEEAVKEKQEGNKVEYKEGEALVIYYTNVLQTTAANDIVLNDAIKVEQTWDFGIVAEKSEVAAQGLDADESNEIIMRVSSDTLSTSELIKRLESNPKVKAAEPNYICKASDLGTNDTYRDAQWSLDNVGQNGGTTGADINPDTIWTDSTNPTAGTEKVIAIIDTGVNYNHEDLKDNMWVNTKQGVLSGVHGYDFANYDNDPLDDYGHGTHCAGIIAADGDNEAGITGVNQSAKIMALKFLDAGGSGSLSGAIDAYNYIYQAQTKLGVDVVAINNSWGGWGEEAEWSIMKKVIDKVGQAGALSICAAGNDALDTDVNNFNIPSCIESDYIISVAASNEKDELATFSCYGKKSVDIAAPGTDILSSVLVDTFNPSIYEDTNGIDDKDAFCDYYSDSSTVNNFSPYVVRKDGTVLTDTTGIIETDASTYFGNETSGESLRVNLSGMKANEYCELMIPYTTNDSTKAIYDSAMVKVDSSKGGFIFADMYDVTLDAEGKPINGPYISGTGAYDMESNYWSHLSGKSVDISTANEKRAIIFVFAAMVAGDYQINIDDLAVSKADLASTAFGKYDFYNGTSMAAPHVTGAVALAATYFDNKNEVLSAVDLRAQIIGSVRQVPALSDKVASGGVLDLSKINQPVPVLKSASLNEEGNIELAGKFFGSSGTLKVNSTEITADNYIWTEDKITIPDQSLVNTKVTFEVTTLSGIVSGSYFIVGATKTAEDVGSIADLYAGGQVVSDGTNLYYMDYANNLYKYSIGDMSQEQYESVMAQGSDIDANTLKELSLIPLSTLNASDIFPDEIIDETNNKMLNIETQLVYSNGKIWAVVANATSYSKDFALVSYHVAEDMWVNEGTVPAEIIDTENYFTLGAYDGMIYCMGGLNMSDYTTSTAVKVFDPTTQAWSDGIDLPEGRFLSIAKQVGDKLVLTLGGDDNGTCPSNLVFDGESWTQQTAVLKPISSTSFLVLDENGTIPIEDWYGNVQNYSEINYYTAQVGVVRGGLIYADLPSDGAGMVYTYDLASDTYAATDYKLTDDSSKTGFLATAVGNILYAMYTEVTGEMYSAKLVSIPIESGLINVSCVSEGGTVNGVGYYLPGETVTLSAIPEEGHFLKSFKLGSTEIDGSSYSFKATTDIEFTTLFGAYVSSIELSKTQANLEAAQTLNLTANVLPENADKKDITWSSSNSDWATVDNAGKVTALEAGNGKEVTITATAADGSDVKAECKVSVVKKATSLTITGEATEMIAGATLLLKANILPENATNKEVTWTSSDTTAASIDNTGKVTAFEVGVGKNVTITATAKDGSGIKAEYKVSIIKKATSLTITGDATELNVGASLLLKATMQPKNVTNAEVTWTSSDNAAASVDNTGKVTALEAGVGKTVTIIATAKDGSGVKAEYKVTIVRNVTAIAIQGKTKKIKPGTSLTLKAVITPTNATNQAVTWTSSNSKYATVNEFGKVKAKVAGGGKTVTITATAKDNSGVTATYKITISKQKITKLTLNKTKVSVTATKKITLKATIAPVNATNKKVKWTTSNKKYATVNSKGVVTTKKAGKGKTVTITATTLDGSKIKESCKIKIK